MKLDSSFEGDLREAVLDETQDALEDHLAQQAVNAAHRRLKEVARRNGYDVESVIDTLDAPTVARNDGSITVEWGWTHEAAIFFDQGTVDHSIEGNPILAFEWPVAEGGPGGMMFRPEVEVAGIEQSRFARHGAEWLARELQFGEK